MERDLLSIFAKSSSHLFLPPNCPPPPPVWPVPSTGLEPTTHLTAYRASTLPKFSSFRSFLWNAATPLLRPLVVIILSPRRDGLGPWPVRDKILIGEVALRRTFLWVFRFFTVGSISPVFHNHPSFNIILVTRTKEFQIKQCFRISRSIEQKRIFTLFFL